jgi:hypothetical protein
MRRLMHPLLVLLALVFLFEAWLWERLAPIVAWIVARIPLRKIKARVAAWVEQLSPAATLVVFVVPVMVLVPLKILVFYLAKPHPIAATAVFMLGKLIGVGVTSFIFDVTKPKLLQLAWFRRLYDRVMIWLDWAHALTDPIKARLKRTFRILSPKRAGRTLRLIHRIRRHMQAVRADWRVARSDQLSD